MGAGAMKLSDLDMPATYINRPLVRSSNRVWGDQEAESAGLYEVGPSARAPQRNAAALPPGFELIPDEPKNDPSALPAGFELIEDAPDPMTAARADLAERLRAGGNANDEIVRTAAFRTNQGVPAAGATDAAVSGALMGWGDEASAALRAPIDMAMRGEGFGEAYEHNLAAERERLEKYKKENPTASTAAEALGAVSSLRLSPSAVSLSVPKLAAQSGAIGGIAGAGAADEGDRLSGAGVGAALGAGVGAAVPGIIKAVGAVAGPVARNVAAAINPERRAVDQLARDMTRDRVTPAAARAQLDEAAASGQPMTILDVGGRNVMGLGRAVATGKGAGSEKVVAMLDARRLDAPDRVVDSLRNVLSDPDAFYPSIERIAARRKEIATPLYEAAYAKAAPDTPIIRSILATPAGQKAVAKAKELSANEGIEFAADVRGLDLVKRALDDMIDTARRGGQANEERILAGMKNRMVREIDRRVPEYAQARKAWSSDFELEQAVERGRALLGSKVDPEVAVKEIRAMSNAEQEMARIGVAREIKAMFENPSYTLSRANQLLNSGRLKPILSEMFPGKSLDKFRGDLMREAVMLRRGQQITGNSTTANKLAEGADSGIGSIALQAARGDRVGAAFNAMSQMSNRLAKGVTEKVADRLGDIFTTTDPATQRAILSQIEGMLSPRQLTELLGMASGRGAPVVANQK